MFEISTESFKSITGIELDHFMRHVMRGDSWGTFLKLAMIIESSAKRAIGLKLGIDPSLEAVLRIEFYASLCLCKEAKLITEEAFEFANSVRHIRNHLAHNGGMMDFDVKKLKGAKFFNKYKNKIQAFVSIKDIKITDGDLEHFNTLIMGCVAFVAILASSLFGENWMEHIVET